MDMAQPLDIAQQSSSVAAAEVVVGSTVDNIEAEIRTLQSRHLSSSSRQ